MSFPSQLQGLRRGHEIGQETKKTVSIGVFAYNEEQNIGRLLENLTHQSVPDGFRLKEIVVVASGCTDKTCDIVRTFTRKSPSVRLVAQSVRMGKPSAVNLFLGEAVGDILVMESADTVPDRESIQRLLEPFREAQVGGASSYPVPLEDSNRPITSEIAQLIWTDLNHEFAIRGAVRLSGELFAIRAGVVIRVPEDIVHEDAYIERVIALGGHRLVYVPSAIVHMRGPSEISELLTQRRKNLAGHFQLEHLLNYEEPTANPFQVARVLVSAIPRVIRESHARPLLIPFAVVIEMVARILAFKDVRKGSIPEGLRDYYLKSTKDVALDINLERQ